MREREGQGKLFDKRSSRKESGKELKLRTEVKQTRKKYTKWDGRESA